MERKSILVIFTFHWVSSRNTSTFRRVSTRNLEKVIIRSIFQKLKLGIILWKFKNEVCCESNFRAIMTIVLSWELINSSLGPDSWSKNNPLQICLKENNCKNVLQHAHFDFHWKIEFPSATISSKIWSLKMASRLASSVFMLIAVIKLDRP